MAVYFGIAGCLIFATLFLSLYAYRVGKNNKEERRIMDRFYNFVAIASIGVKDGHITKEQEEAVILDMKEAVVGGSVLERLRKLDAVMDRFSLDAEYGDHI